MKLKNRKEEQKKTHAERNEQGKEAEKGECKPSQCDLCLFVLLCRMKPLAVLPPFSKEMQLRSGTVKRWSSQGEQW